MPLLKHQSCHTSEPEASTWITFPRPQHHAIVGPPNLSYLSIFICFEILDTTPFFFREMLSALEMEYLIFEIDIFLVLLYRTWKMAVDTKTVVDDSSTATFEAMFWDRSVKKKMNWEIKFFKQNLQIKWCGIDRK